MPDISSTIVKPATPQTTSTLTATVASGLSTSHAVDPSVIPSPARTALTAPLLGCSLQHAPRS